MTQLAGQFWSTPTEQALRDLQTSRLGLTSEEARRRLKLYGPNLLKPKRRSNAIGLLLAQFRSPLIVILLVAAAISFFLHEPVDASIIVGIVLLSGLLGFYQEYKAASAVEKLLAIVQVKAEVLRDGRSTELLVEEIVPGDIVLLNAGDVIAGDCLLIESKDLFVDEAALTGETFPSEKHAGIAEADAPLAQRSDTLFMGTHVISGTATAVVTLTGVKTEFGKVSERLAVKPAETEFEHGIRRFGYLLTHVTLVFVVIIFAISVFLSRPVIDSFLFAVALAVGLVPEMLPAIISVSLAIGAERMARKKVIVKQLASIENLGQMNVLCSDKTGTLTEGLVRLNAALDVGGNESEKVNLYAYLNALYETGFTNPIDAAIRAHRQFDTSDCTKLDEVPYDFIRKRLSVLVSIGAKKLLLTKGALRNVVDVCSHVETSSGALEEIACWRDKIESRYEEMSKKGFRTLGIAYKDAGSESRIAKQNEAEMVFLGFLILFDPPKEAIEQTINQLQGLGIALKIITGDNRHVATSVGAKVGLPSTRVVVGADLNQMTDAALKKQANDVDIFAEVEPNQKERIILALRKSGNAVGYLGDGINDAPALHSADVGISVNSAVDVAKEAASIVLLEKDLGVLVDGVREGRRTFANTLKYIFMTTSANFGNMFSMAIASLFLPFLPLLPKQIILNNFLTDFPAMAIATDEVDAEMVEKPVRWNMKFTRSFMIVFGIVSSAFDLVTFGVLLFALKASADQFRTGWFLESVFTELLIVPVIRTTQPFYKSKPSKLLVIATAVIFVVSLALPYSPLGPLLGFTRLPLSFLLAFLVITALYVFASELTKKFFYMRHRFDEI